nr:exonuclease subunit SbcD [Lachnospiraceae bacterium]
MRLLHTSDWHLGMTFRGGITFAPDQKYAIDNIIRIAREEKAEGILISGDVFDKSIAGPEALKLYDHYITYICAELQIPVFIIAGNHDGAERLSQLKDLLKNSGLFVAGSVTRDPIVVNRGDVDIYLLPW